MATSSKYTRSYSSFCGVDIRATFAHKYIGELQGVSYTVTREKAPLYTMGSPDPRSFSRGKRGIAGSLIFLTFDREALLEGLRDLRYMANRDDIRGAWDPDPQPVNNPYASASQIASPGASVGSAVLAGVVTAANTIAGIGQESLQKSMAKPMYYDQIPPFNIVLTAGNEYGHTMLMDVKGVEIMNAGSGTSIDDITIDTTCTFVATSIIPWREQGYVDDDGVWRQAHGERYLGSGAPGSGS